MKVMVAANLFILLTGTDFMMAMIVARQYLQLSKRVEGQVPLTLFLIPLSIAFRKVQDLSHIAFGEPHKDHKTLRILTFLQ